LKWQYDWRGATVQNLKMLVCQRCYDTPQEQLRSFAVPPDPVPIINPRVQDFVAASTDQRVTSGQNSIDPVTGIPVPGGNTRITQSNLARTPQQTGEAPGGLNEEPGTDPTVPTELGGDDPGLPYGATEVPKTGPLFGEE
jgi:hypothetical protein